MATIITIGCSSDVKSKGNFEIYDFGDFKLHVYNTNDALGDASYIIEGKNGLVTCMTPPN